MCIYFLVERDQYISPQISYLISYIIFYWWWGVCVCVGWHWIDDREETPFMSFDIAYRFLLLATGQNTNNQLIPAVGEKVKELST